MVTYDFKCTKCKHEFTTTVDRMGDMADCIKCGATTTRIFLAPPTIKLKTATPIEKGIRKDITEMSLLEEIRDTTRDKGEAWSINQEIEKINHTPVTGGK